MIRKHYAALYQGLEHPRMWASEGVLKQGPRGYRGTAASFCSKRNWNLMGFVEGAESHLEHNTVLRSCCL